jgi:flagellar basal-body rod modification protein FlgD
MAVNAVNAVTPPSTDKPANSEGSRKTLAGDLSQFLNLLTTQLKYQDPLSPMDSTQFTAQLAQFASVEQGIQTNKNLESLIGLTQASQISTGVSYIGRTVEADSNVGALIDGHAEFLYNIPKTAQQTSITVRDAKNQVVVAKQGETSVGSHNFVWDGKDANGNKMPDGPYTVTVSAMDAKNTPIPVSTHMLGRVDGVVTADGAVNVLVGGVAIPLDKILSVKETKTATVP